MNFFKEQDLVRQRLKVFRTSFYLTVLCTALATATCLYLLPNFTVPVTENPFGPGAFYLSKFYWMLVAATIGFIVIMSELKMWQLKAGGEYIAKMAGATALPVYLTDIRHKRLKNVVEEMSIASGIVPPKIYIMRDENHINAFAAGFTTHDAVIGISEGCLNKLTREELQGVVAHELGHIVNGDMKLNLQLIGYLFGLMGISEIGRFMLRSTNGNNNRKKNNIAPLGLGLFLIGIMGYFLGLLLKQRIGRGQEFGADAKAVQFTRNPDGIAGALKKILSVGKDFKVTAPKAHQLEHMYFFYPQGMLDLLATHPPLEDRILKIQPTFKYVNFKKTEEKQLTGFMNLDISKEIEKSFASTLSPLAQETAAVTEIEAKGELKARALTFFKIISVPGDMTASDELIREMDLVLGRLRSLELEESRSLIKQLKEIIVADKLIIPREILCYTLFKESLIPRLKAPARNLGLQKVEKQVSVMLAFLAGVSSDSETAKQESFKLGVEYVYPGLKLSLNTKVTINEITEAFELSRDLIPMAKKRLLEASLVVIEHDKSENFNKSVFMKVLNQIMGVPTVSS